MLQRSCATFIHQWGQPCCVKACWFYVRFTKIFTGQDTHRFLGQKLWWQHSLSLNVFQQFTRLSNSHAAPLTAGRGGATCKGSHTKDNNNNQQQQQSQGQGQVHTNITVLSKKGCVLHGKSAPSHTTDNCLLCCSNSRAAKCA